MAFRLTTGEMRAREKLLDQLDVVSEGLSEAVTVFNRRVADAWPEVAAAQEKFNAKVAEAQAFVNAVHGSREKEFDAHSDEWKDGTAGQRASMWLDAWSLTLEDSDIEKPEDIEVVSTADADLDDLPADVKDV